MTTYEGIPGPVTYLGMVLNNAIQKSKARQRAKTVAGNSVQSRWFKIMARIVLHIVGFSALTNAMFQWNIIAGWLAVAVSCFAFSFLFTSDAEPTDTQNGQMRR